MTSTANSRLAGVTIFLYIASGLSSLALAGRTHAVDVLAVCTSFCALVLGVTLYALTRGEDADIALLGLVCRVIEGMPATEGTIYFAVGSTLFSWLFLRGRLVPIPLAWLGVVASLALTVILVLQRGGLLGGAASWASRATWMVWLPMLVFEVTLGVWLLTRGVAAPAEVQTA